MFAKYLTDAGEGDLVELFNQHGITQGYVEVQAEPGAPPRKKVEWVMVLNEQERTERKFMYLRTEMARVAENLKSGFYDAEKASKDLVGVILKVNDDKVCLDSCKGMYFCMRRRGHKGPHRDGQGLYW